MRGIDGFNADPLNIIAFSNNPCDAGEIICKLTLIAPKQKRIFGMSNTMVTMTCLCVLWMSLKCNHSFWLFSTRTCIMSQKCCFPITATKLLDIFVHPFEHKHLVFVAHISGIIRQIQWHKSNCAQAIVECDLSKAQHTNRVHAGPRNTPNKDGEGKKNIRFEWENQLAARVITCEYNEKLHNTHDYHVLFNQKIWPIMLCTARLKRFAHNIHNHRIISFRCLFNGIGRCKNIQIKTIFRTKNLIRFEIDLCTIVGKIESVQWIDPWCDLFWCLKLCVMLYKWYMKHVVKLTLRRAHVSTIKKKKYKF